MCQLLETIKLENGELVNLEYHNLRFNKARRELFSLPAQDLGELINIPADCQTGVYRCRVVYAEQIEKVEFIPHHPRQIKSLQVVHGDAINYSYKYADRSQLQELYDKRGNADEIIIIKNGLATDCFIGNLVFFDGEKWWTPDRPLLKGTQRQKLMNEGKIHEKQIAEKAVFSFQAVGIINVFYNLETMPIVETVQIYQ